MTSIPPDWEAQWLDIERNILRSATVLNQVFPFPCREAPLPPLLQTAKQQQLDDRMQMYHKVQALCSCPRRARGQGALEFVLDCLRHSLQKWIVSDVLQPLGISVSDWTDEPGAAEVHSQVAAGVASTSEIASSIAAWKAVTERYFLMQRLVYVWFLYVNHNSSGAVQKIYRAVWRRVFDENGTAVQNALVSAFSSSMCALGGESRPSSLSPANEAARVISMIDEAGASFLVTAVCERVEEALRRNGLADCVESLREASTTRDLDHAIEVLSDRIGSLERWCEAFFGVGSELSKMRTAAAMQSYFNGLGDSVETWRAALSSRCVLDMWVSATETTRADSTDAGGVINSYASLTFVKLLRISFCSGMSLLGLFESTFAEALQLHLESTFVSLQCTSSQSLPLQSASAGQIVIRMCEEGEGFIEKHITAVDARRRLSKHFLTALQNFVAAKDGELVPSLCRELLEQMKSVAPHEGGFRRLDALATVMTLLPSKDLFFGQFAALLARYLLSAAGAGSAEEYCGVLQRVALRVGMPLISPLLTMVREARSSRTFTLGSSEDGAGASASTLTLLTASRWKPFLSQSLLWTKEQLLAVCRSPPHALSPLGNAAEAFEQFQQSSVGAVRRFLWVVTVGTVHVSASYEHAVTVTLRLSPIVCIVVGVLWELCNSLIAPVTLEQVYDALVSQGQVSRRLVQVILHQAATAGIIQCLSSSGTPSYSVPKAPTTRERKLRITTPQQKLGGSVDHGSIALESDLSEMVLSASSGGGANISAARKKKIEACVVRVMKRAKSLSHTDLLERVGREMQQHFQVSITLFKECVGQLLEKEYIIRDEFSSDLYHYVA